MCRAQNFIIPEDMQFIYDLPYEKGKKVFVSQGYFGRFSHKKQYAIDFKLKKGTKILAARSGKVTKVVDKYTKGGPFRKYISYGNYVIIKHDDHTYAAYWHLQEFSAKVKKGDWVEKGQWIANSGHTGYSTMPHLHFDVYYYDENNKSTTIPTKFNTHKGARFLRTYRCYKSPD